MHPVLLQKSYCTDPTHVHKYVHVPVQIPVSLSPNSVRVNRILPAFSRRTASLPGVPATELNTAQLPVKQSTKGWSFTRHETATLTAHWLIPGTGWGQTSRLSYRIMGKHQTGSKWSLKYTVLIRVRLVLETNRDRTQLDK